MIRSYNPMTILLDLLALIVFALYLVVVAVITGGHWLWGEVVDYFRPRPGGGQTRGGWW